MRFPRFVPFVVCLALNTFSLFAQSPNGNINGLVSDPSSAAVVGAELVAVNDVTSRYWPQRNKGTTDTCSAFLRWRIDDYRQAALHFPPDIQSSPQT